MDLKHSAMKGTSTAQALETADVALMADDLSQLPAPNRGGRRSVNTIVKAIVLIQHHIGQPSIYLT